MRTETEARDALEAWLSKNDKSQAWLAKQCGISQPSVSEWIAGTSRPKPFFRDVIETLTGITAEKWQTADEQQVVANARQIAADTAARTGS